MPIFDTELVSRVITGQEISSAKKKEAMLLLMMATEIAKGVSSTEAAEGPFTSAEIGDRSFRIAQTILLQARAWAEQEAEETVHV